jgi:hypothetical protein
MIRVLVAGRVSCLAEAGGSSHCTTRTHQKQPSYQALGSVSGPVMRLSRPGGV